MGGRLVLTRFATDEGLFRRTLAAAGPDGVLDAVITLSRAGQDDPETAVALVINLLDDDVDRWSDVLLAAVSQQSAATAALEALVRREDTRCRSRTSPARFPSPRRAPTGWA